MDVQRPGQRILMALASSSDNEDPATDSAFNVQGILLAGGSMLCLILMVLMCACKEEKSKSDESPGSGKSNREDVVEAVIPTERKASEVGVNSVENGGSQSNRNSANMSKHSRQPSSASGNNVRPTSLRELPEPPVGAHHSRNTSMSGVQIVAVSSVAPPGVDEAPNETNLPQRDLNPDDDGYDHLGQKNKPVPQPTDYDQLGPAIVTPDLDTPISEVSSGMDGHYSQPKERMYAVCKDVRPKNFPATFDSNDKVETGSNHYSHVSEEDPYNQINDSGGTLPSSVIQRIRQSTLDADDPYATVQDESGGSYKAVMQAVGGAKAKPGNPALLNPVEENETGEDEYAVVQKVGVPRSVLPSEERRNGSEEEISPYSVRPPEPPRLYEGYVEEENIYEEGSDQTINSKEHKYSKVTARESLASMSARNALNPYEMVVDIPENTYATVEGGSGDGVVQEVSLRNRLPGMMEEENRLSQNSDTYAEIAISGGGLTTSVTSNTSTSSNTTATILGTSSGSSGAPIPPSLDSLPQMSKSITSSEGDRLSDRMSDRFLGSPDERVLPVQFGDLEFSDNEGEDGYSTLTRADGAASSLRGDSARPVNGIHSDSQANGHDNYEDSANDPNYESVDELRAKVALLKAKDEAGQAMSLAPHVTILDLKTKEESQTGSDQPIESRITKRRRHHDYEEVDISPPQSPQTPLLVQPENAEPDLAEEVKERVLNGHTYEEVAQIQARKGQAKKTNTAEGKKKSGAGEEKEKEKDKKKSKEEKKKNKSEEKKKNSDSSRSNTWDGSKKSHSWEANRTRL